MGQGGSKKNTTNTATTTTSGQSGSSNTNSGSTSNTTGQSTNNSTSSTSTTKKPKTTKAKDDDPVDTPVRKESSAKVKRDTAKDDGGFSLKRLEKLYEKYKDPNEDYIGPDGVGNFLKEIEIDAEDVVTLVLAWRLKAAEMGYFSQQEFIEGFKDLGCDSVEKIKGKIQFLRDEMKDSAKFKEIYRFGFHFAKEDADKKVLPLDMADAMMKLILGTRNHVDNYCKFLHEQDSYKVVNLDQWMSFLEFSKTIAPDLSDYDENSAWPVLIDMFVEWSREKGLAAPPKDKESN